MNEHDVARLVAERWDDATMYFHRHRLRCTEHEIGLFVERATAPVVCWVGESRWTECATWLAAAGMIAVSPAVSMEPLLIVIDD